MRGLEGVCVREREGTETETVRWGHVIDNK